MASSLQEHINKAIEAAEYGAEDIVKAAIDSMTHRDFGSKEIVFKLNNYFGPTVKRMLKRIISERTRSSFQDRVRYIIEA